MNKYKVFYYMSVLVLIVNAFAMVGTLLGWFYFVESKYLFWINLVLLSIFNWLEKKEKMMNKYKVIYYVVVAALLVSVFLLIGIDLGWFSPYQSNQFVWAYFALIPVIEWIEKKSKNQASEKGE